LVSLQQKVGEYAPTFVDFPPMQRGELQSRSSQGRDRRAGKGDERQIGIAGAKSSRYRRPGHARAGGDASRIPYRLPLRQCWAHCRQVHPSALMLICISIRSFQLTSRGRPPGLSGDRQGASGPPFCTVPKDNIAWVSPAARLREMDNACKGFEPTQAPPIVMNGRRTPTIQANHARWRSLL
jgi:hypothetical protein